MPSIDENAQIDFAREKISTDKPNLAKTAGETISAAPAAPFTTLAVPRGPLPIAPEQAVLVQLSVETSTPHPPSSESVMPATTPNAKSESESPQLVSAAKNEKVKQHALDQVKPIEISTFPNQPRSGLQVVPATIPNLIHLLSWYGIAVRYDVIRKRIFINLPGHEGSVDNMDQTALTYIISLATLNGFQIGQVPAYLEAISDRTPFNPVATWIMSRSWDLHDRLPELYATLTVRDGFPDDLKNIFLRRWLLSAVAAAMLPRDFRSRGVFTLQGPQGIGKTSFFASLVDNVVLRAQVVKLDHHIDPSNKDTLISAVSHWIVELGELESSLKRDIPRLKGFITAGTDKMRRPYGRVDVEYPRRTVFCASVNDNQFLIDSTGNSRFWTVPVTQINFMHGLDMQQVFAQLYVEFQSSAQWWLSKSEEDRLEFFNREHQSISAIALRLLETVEVARAHEQDLPAMSAIEVLREIGIDNPTNPQCKECGAFLREHFGESKRNKGRDTWRVPMKLRSVHTNLSESDIY